MKPDGTATGLFPGRFQPFTNAHLERLLAIRSANPALRLIIVLGDVDCLNRENFLYVEERREMIEVVCNNRGIEGVLVTSVAAAYPPDLWVRNVLRTVPGADTVFSDNPFVYGPLESAGLRAVVHERCGTDSSILRRLPFSEWRSLVPPEVFTYVASRGLYERMLRLPSSGRYPFIGPGNQGDTR